MMCMDANDMPTNETDHGCHRTYLTKHLGSIHATSYRQLVRAPQKRCVHGYYCHPPFVRATMENESEYFFLSAESKKQYCCKVSSCGLKVDPYSISSWTEDPSILAYSLMCSGVIW